MSFCMYNLQADQSIVRHAETQAQAQQHCQSSARAAEPMSAAAAGILSPGKTLCCFLTHAAIMHRPLWLHGVSPNPWHPFGFLRVTRTEVLIRFVRGIISGRLESTHDQQCCLHTYCFCIRYLSDSHCWCMCCSHKKSVNAERSGMKRQHDSDTSTLPNTRAHKFCSLCDDIQHALRADSSTVAQQQQAEAAQIVYTDRVSPRASCLSAVYEACLKGYGVRHGVYSNASLFANALSPAESGGLCRKRQKQDAADSAVEVTASAAHHQLSTSLGDSRSAAASGAVDLAQDLSTRTGSDAEQQPADQAHGEGTSSLLGQKRQLARLDSNTGSSPASSAAKKPCVPARPVAKGGQQSKADPEQVHDTEASLAGRLHRELSGSVNSRMTTLHASTTCGSGPAKSGSITAPSHQFSATTGKHGHACEPPRFNQTKPAVGKSRMAPGSSQQGRGGGVRSPVRSGAASGDSGARQQSKGSGSVRTAGMGGTQDTAAASDGSLPHKKAPHRYMLSPPSQMIRLWYGCQVSMAAAYTT